MGGLTAFASTAMQAFSLANTIAKGVSDYRTDSGYDAYKEAKKKNAIEMAALEQKTKLEKEQNQLQKEQADQDRMQKLRAAIAQQRAIYGANGVGSGAGSSQAYLLGLVKDAEEDSDALSYATQLKNRILDNAYNERKSLNTLALTQARDKNSLNKVTALYNGTNDGLGLLTDIF